MSEREFLKEKDLLLNSIEKNTVEHWGNYYSNVPIKCIFEDLVIDINEIKRLTEENQGLKNQIEALEKTNKQLISKLDRYDAIVDERDELKKQLRTSAIFNEEDIRLDQTKEVFETLANILNTESCSYRYLIYDLLGFKKENYIDLIAGMSITNAIVELEELENQQKEFIEYLKHQVKLQEELNDIHLATGFEEILQKYKEIIGGKE